MLGVGRQMARDEKELQDVLAQTKRASPSKKPSDENTDPKSDSKPTPRRPFRGRFSINSRS